MNLGREIVACAIRAGSLKPFIEAGLTSDWLTSTTDLSRAAVFVDLDLDAYRTLIRHWDKHGKLPSLDMFRLSFPESTYRLPDTAYTPAEVIEVFEEDRERWLAEIAASDVADLLAAGDAPGAVDLMESAARMIRSSRRTSGVTLAWDGPEYDVDGRISRVVEPGVLTGIPELDDGFIGWQPGNLVTYLGRAKAGKTSFLLLSALKAFLGDDDNIARRVMIVTVEIAASEVTDRLDAFSANISLSDYQAGRLAGWDHRKEAEKLRSWRKKNVEKYDGGGLRVVQPTGRYTVTDLEYDIDQYAPDVVYVDGFYFLVDRQTGKSGGSWEGHDNLARDLKELAMRRKNLIIVSHQVREKQLTGKKGAGIDDGAMMGGTGLVMASDMVLGIDADDSKGADKVHTISCTRSRTGYLKTVKGTWDWNTSAFTVRDNAEFDESKFDTGRDSSGDAPF